jgi:hypothetical protein
MKFWRWCSSKTSLQLQTAGISTFDIGELVWAIPILIHREIYAVSGYGAHNICGSAALHARRTRVPLQPLGGMFIKVPGFEN